MPAAVERGPNVEGSRAAAVLVPLYEVADETGLVLIKRPETMSSHRGEIAFPGGKFDEGVDGDLRATALREAHEEVGLPPDHVEVIGRLDTYVTGTGFEITPVVGFVRTPYPVKLDPFEVAEAFEVPLSFVVDPTNHQKQSREARGVTRTFFVLPYGNRYIWGATAGMLVNLAEVLTS